MGAEQPLSSTDAPGDLLGCQCLIAAAAFVWQAGQWYFVQGTPDAARDKQGGCLRTEVACLAAFALLLFCVGLLALWLERVRHSADRLQLLRQVVVGRLTHQNKEQLVVRGGLAVAGCLSGRWLMRYQYLMPVVVIVSEAKFFLVGVCGTDADDLLPLLLLYPPALWLLPQDGWSETALAPGLAMVMKWASGMRGPDSGARTCVGFMERLPLSQALVMGVHSVLCGCLAPGLPEFALQSAAAYVGLGAVEHWLRYWDAVAAHQPLVASGEEGLLQGVLLGNGDNVSVWEGAMLSLLLYLASGVAASGLFLYARHQAETALVRQAMKDSRRMLEQGSVAGHDS